MAATTAGGPVLVNFFDFAQLNSVRALPYVVAWAERYGPHGLATLGVHSPRFRFTGERDALAPALNRLGVNHPVADDSGYVIYGGKRLTGQGARGEGHERRRGSESEQRIHIR